MKRILIALATGTMLISAAHAGDLGRERGASTKDAPLPIPQAIAVDDERPVNWSGFYIGGQAGYGNANHNLKIEEYQNARDAIAPKCTGGTLNDTGTGCAQVCTTPALTKSVAAPSPVCTTPGTFVPGSPAIEAAVRKLFDLAGINSAGFIGGGQLGYDQQLGRFVIGVFGSYNLSSMETTLDVLPGTPVALHGSLEKDDEWSVGARVGILVNPRTLAYILAAYTETTYNLSGGGLNKDFDFSGVTAGAGIEFSVTKNIFLGMEYTHSFYDEKTLFDSKATAPGAVGVRVKDDLDEDKIMATLKIKLNSDLFSAR